MTISQGFMCMHFLAFVQRLVLLSGRNAWHVHSPEKRRLVFDMAGIVTMALSEIPTGLGIVSVLGKGGLCWHTVHVLQIIETTKQ